MSRLIRCEEIDQLYDVRAVADASIKGVVVEQLRKLPEVSIEKFLREILFDPNQTPHGPTEIADVLTSRVHINGQPKLSAFVLKGPSFPKVGSRDVAHQFLKLRQIPQLGLAVFLAVGHIQDDAQRDFVQTAVDAGADYLIIDVQLCARLFVAYQKICPEDGTPFEQGKCAEGHVIDPGIQLQMGGGEDLHTYTIVNQKDVSHGGAKRYSVDVLVDPRCSRSAIRYIIEEVVQTIRNSNYYRNDLVRARWGQTPAHVVWVYVAKDLTDMVDRNWSARAEWIDTNLPKEFSPLAQKEDEAIGDIQIFWNSNHDLIKQLRDTRRATKGGYFDALNPIRREIIENGEAFVSRFQD